MTNSKLKMIKQPFTPIMRRFLQDIFKPSHTLGKRSRDEDEENVPLPHGEPAKETRRPNCLALQNEDLEEDAVVITALSAIPFCCHADLLAMSRDELIAVARELNEKLPLALKIDINASRPDNFIRNSVEILVGIRREVPPAPKAKRSLSMSLSVSDDFADTSFNSNLHSSPLTKRGRINNLLTDDGGTPRLVSVREEEEYPERVASDRPQKRRRISASSPIPTPAQSQRMVTRLRSHGVAPRSRSSAPKSSAARVLRSQSQQILEVQHVEAHRYVTTTRGRGRLRSHSAVMTSTPKTYRHIDRPLPVSLTDSAEDMSISPPSTISSSTTVSRNSTPRGKKRRRYSDRSICDSDDAKEVTTGIKDMTMTSVALTSESDMSIISTE